MTESSATADPSPPHFQGDPIPIVGQGYVGAIEALDFGGLRGWIYRPDAIAHAHLPVEVNVIIDNQVAARGLTDLPRPDVMGGAENAPLNTGFMIPLPKLDLGALDETVTITVIAFAIGHDRARFRVTVARDLILHTQFFAHLSLSANKLTGWWVDKQLGDWSAPKAKITAENTRGERFEIESTPHPAVRNDLSAPAFSIDCDLPGAFAIGAMPIRFATESPRSPLFLRQAFSVPLLYHAWVEDEYLRGWAVNLGDPLRRPQVRLIERHGDETAVQSTRATLFHRPLYAVDVFDGYCGFDFGLDPARRVRLTETTVEDGVLILSVESQIAGPAPVQEVAFA